VHAGAAAAVLALAATALLAACGSAPVPPTVWIKLPADAGGAGGASPAATPASSAPGAAREVWQLMLPLPLPAHLERDGLFVPLGAGAAVLSPLAGVRWAEPLRDAVPRLLREDLARALGVPLWQAPLPPGLVVTRQLRIEITAFEIAGDARSLLTQARWSLADARGATPPRVHEARFETAAAAATPEAWALAHRRAISTLAARIAATAGS
jgi:hypothetical protein